MLVLRQHLTYYFFPLSVHIYISLIDIFFILYIYESTYTYICKCIMLPVFLYNFNAYFTVLLHIFSLMSSMKEPFFFKVNFCLDENQCWVLWQSLSNFLGLQMTNKRVALLWKQSAVVLISFFASWKCYTCSKYIDLMYISQLITLS